MNNHYPFSEIHAKIVALILLALILINNSDCLNLQEEQSSEIFDLNNLEFNGSVLQSQFQ